MMIKIDAIVREEKFEDVKAALKCHRSQRYYGIAGYGMRCAERI